MKLPQPTPKLTAALNSQARGLLCEHLRAIRSGELEKLPYIPEGSDFRFVQGRVAMLDDLMRHFDKWSP